MSSFVYNNGVPAANDNPSDDQPDMLTNAQSIQSILAVDHVGFNTANGGTHLQVTITSNNTPSTPVNPSSVIFTDAGTDIGGVNSNSQVLFTNAVGTYLLSCIRAFGSFTSSPGAVSSFNNAFPSNMTISGSVSSYTITLPANLVTGNNIVVLLSSTGSNSSFIPTWSFTNPTLTISNVQSSVSRIVSFLILQN